MAERDELAELRAEVDRLRELVGPSEQSYDDLRQDLLAARDAARGAEAAAGALRGQLVELHVQLERARQEQEHAQRMLPMRVWSATGRSVRSWRARLS